MKSALTCLLLLPGLAFAMDGFERERLERACMIEQGSLLKERNGTPSCAKLKQAGKKQKRASAAKKAGGTSSLSGKKSSKARP